MPHCRPLVCLFPPYAHVSDPIGARTDDRGLSMRIIVAKVHAGCKATNSADSIIRLGERGQVESPPDQASDHQIHQWDSSDPACSG